MESGFGSVELERVSRSKNTRLGHKKGGSCWRDLSASDRQIEHQRRRAKLKRQTLGEETKTERVYERWDKWNWD